MSIIMYDSEVDHKPPLESSIPRPPSFHVYQTLLSAPFSNEFVYFPFGFEDAANAAPSELCATTRRIEAPFPGFHSSTGVGIRPLYASFMAANWINFYDTRITPAQFLIRDGARTPPKEMLAVSMLAEMTSAAADALSPTIALGRSTIVLRGPHESQRSRRIAATLLLPRAQLGRRRANVSDILFLEAFALIAASTNRPCFAVDANGIPSSPENTKDTALTAIVRLSVVVGSATVAAFAKTIGIASTPIFASDEWKQSPVLCLSYVVGNSVVHSPIVLPVGVATDTVGRVVRTIQNAALKAQILSKGKLVLPHGFVSTEYVANIDEDDMDHAPGESHFLRLQALQQTAFRRLLIKETTVDVPMDVVRQFQTESSIGKPRFVRICSNTTSIDNLKDESHCPGLLFTTNEELMLEYLHRNRLQAPPNQWTMQWPPYGLSPAIDEERRANISLLWFRVETHALGSQLNLFFPRVCMGAEVTDARGSRVFAVVPTLCSVESVIRSGNYVLPCTPDSMLPMGHGEMSSRLYNAFVRAFDESFDFMNDLKAQVAIGEVERPSTSLYQAAEIATEAPPEASEGADDAFITALIGAKIGHPSSTCGDAYDLLQAHMASEFSYSQSFYALVAAGVAKLGADASMSRLMDEAASALIERLSLCELESEYDPDADRKRPRTPSGAVRSPATTSPLPLPIGSRRQDSTASFVSNAPTLSNATLLAPIPITRQDSLQRHLCNDTNLRRLARVGGLQPYELPGFDNGEACCSLPLDAAAVEDLIEAISLAHAVHLELFQDVSSIANDIGLPAAAMSLLNRFLDAFQFVYEVYRRILQNGGGCLDDVETYVLFRPFEGTDASMHLVSPESDNSTQLKRVGTEMLLEPMQKQNRVLFCMSALPSATQHTIDTDSPTQARFHVWRSVPHI